MKTGLVSVTFRQFGIEKIVSLVKEAGLDCIEWGSDVHVTDIDAAKTARRACVDNGIEICSLGSYYRVDQPDDELKKMLEIADDLGTDMIRIWCGSRGSLEASEKERKGTTENLIKCCEIAGNKKLSLEFHGGTLTDSVESARRLFEDTKEVKNLRFHWQPRWDWTFDTNLDALDTVKARIGNMHVFKWDHTPEVIRKPLIEDRELLSSAFSICPNAPALIEFVENDSEECFINDAKALKRMINEL